MATSDPFLGRQIGNYRLIALLNRGNFGSVYQGQHIVFSKKPVVAVKILHAPLRTEQDHADFVNEAQTLYRLQHPHILPVIDAGFEQNQPYLVMEYAPGGTLRDHLQASKGHPLMLDKTVSILTQIGEALVFAHQQNVIHRDLKPENILFNASGEALLADFGIAVILATIHTRKVGLGGTPSYMAPEQFEGYASTKSDQYALGCIAYELVTGHRLFAIPNRSLEAYWYHHAKVEPKPPTQLNPQLPTHIEQAILTALTKDRSQRHQDISTFCKALVKSKSQKEWLLEGYTLYGRKRYEEALVALDPNYAFGYDTKGNVLNTLKRYEEALVAFEQAIHVFPYDPNAYYGKGTALNGLKRHEEALVAFEQAIRLFPNFALAYYDKGTTLNDLKRHEEALAAYEQAIRLNPNFALAYYNKGLALDALDRHEEAEQAYEKARQLGYTG